MVKLVIGDIIEFYSPDDNTRLTGQVIAIYDKPDYNATVREEQHVSHTVLEVKTLFETKQYMIKTTALYLQLNHGQSKRY